MKQLLLSAIKVRQRLIRANKSHIKGTAIEIFMNNLQYWLEQGTDPLYVANKWDKNIRTILTNNFINKYNTLKNGITL